MELAFEDSWDYITAVAELEPNIDCLESKFGKFIYITSKKFGLSIFQVVDDWTDLEKGVADHEELFREIRKLTSGKYANQKKTIAEQEHIQVSSATPNNVNEPGRPFAVTRLSSFYGEVSAESQIKFALEDLVDSTDNWQLEVSQGEKPFKVRSLKNGAQVRLTAKSNSQNNDISYESLTDKNGRISRKKILRYLKSRLRDQIANQRQRKFFFNRIRREQGFRVQRLNADCWIIRHKSNTNNAVTLDINFDTKTVYIFETKEVYNLDTSNWETIESDILSYTGRAYYPKK